MIRDAKHEDIERSRSLIEFAYKRIPHSDLVGYDWLHIKRIMTLAITMPNFFSKVSEHNGELRGAIWGVLDTDFWGRRVGSGIACFSTLDTPELIESFEQWSKEKGALFYTVTDTSNNERFRKLLNHENLDEYGVTYSKVI